MSHKISRRDALKILGLSPIAASLLLSATPSEVEGSEDLKGKIVIVGGGSGAIMTLSRLLRALKNPDITIIAPNTTHIYQPGQVFVAAHEMQYEELFLDNNDYIDTSKVQWIKDQVCTFFPDNNFVTTRLGKKIEYDYLIIATGIQYHYEEIKGLTKEDIGKNGISSVYLNDLEHGTALGAIITRNWFKELKQAAKTSKPKVIYTQPSSPIKCGGAPQKILYLSADYLKQEGLSADYYFVSGLKSLFHLPQIDQALHKTQKRYDKIENRFQHHLQSIDVKNKKATFIHAYEEEVYDKDFDTYEKVSKSQEVVLDYDFIHIVPPMRPVDALKKSNLLDTMGWLEVNQYSLQHKRYNNIFGIGDVCGIPMGKTGGSARHHSPIVVENLLALMRGEKPQAKFDGYTVCPLKTQYGKIIMAEFNYSGPAPTFPLDFEKPRWIWWFFDLHMLKPIYQHLMLPGRF